VDWNGVWGRKQQRICGGSKNNNRIVQKNEESRVQD